MSTSKPFPEPGKPSKVLDMLAGFMEFVNADPAEPTAEEIELGIKPVHYTEEYQQFVYNLYQEAGSRIMANTPAEDEDEWVVFERDILPQLKAFTNVYKPE